MTEFPFWQQLVLGLAGALALAGPTIFFGWRDRQRAVAEREAIKSEGIESLTKAATDVVKLLEPYKVELSDVRVELDEQKKRRMAVEQEIRKVQERHREDVILLERRVEALEFWIVSNTDMDPSKIFNNGNS